MKLSICESCGKLVHFEDAACRGCGAPLGFIPGDMALTTLAGGREDGTVVPTSRPDEVWRRCVNAEAVGCNWLVPVEAEDPRCPSCRLNRNLADMNVPAQPRQVAGARMRQAAAPLCAEALRGADRLAEGWREARAGVRLPRGEPRGAGDDRACQRAHHHQHLRGRTRRSASGSGWRWASPTGRCSGTCGTRRGITTGTCSSPTAGGWRRCRALFGDESESYAEALERYYEQGPEPGWEEGYISAYATMHPWEDFAETWTHYLHMVDTLDTGASFGLSVNPTVGEDPRNAAVIDFDPYRPPDLASLTRAWLPLTAAVNSLNRSMGQPDLYPFDPSPGVLAKVRFIHDLLHPPARGRGANRPAPDAACAARREEQFMHVFTCQNCGQLLHFENVVCMRCGMTLGFLPPALTLSALDLAPSGDHWTRAGGRRRLAAVRQPERGGMQLDGASTARRTSSACPATSTAPSPTCRWRATRNAGGRSKRRSGG